jgi:hypothetical protein
VNTATTNASGVATSAVFTANATAGGPYNVAASATGATSANFALTNTAGAPAKVAATSGTPQSAPINTAFGAPLVATVTDAGNNPVSGVVVTFTPPASGASGTFAGGVNTATTNASGVATSATFTANSTVGGPYNVVASATGAASANFALTNNAGPPAKVSVTSGSGQSATINTAFAAPLVATVTDAGNNPVSGVVVTFTPPANGASGSFAGGVNTATTNVSGVATSAVFTASSTAGGPYNVVASVSGATSANFSLTNKTGPPAKVAATSGTPQSATIGTAFAAPLAATVTDAGNNPVAGVLVTFTPPASGASGSFAGGVNTATTTASGVATSAVFTANATAGGPYNVVAGAVGATSANFALTNNNPMPAITPPLVPASTTAGGAAFLLTINGTNFVAGATVTFGSNPALTPVSITPTKITVTIPAADFTSAGTPNVTVTNPGPGGGASAPAAFTVNNPVPTLATATAGGNTHISGGAAFVLTVTGTNFISGNAGESTVINFNGKAEPTTFVSATQVTAAIPASDAATAGTFPVTVTNPAPGGGTTAAVNFTIDGFTLSGPATTTVQAGKQAMIQISVKPTANGFTNAVTSFSVSGLPAHTAFSFSPTSVTPNGATVTTTLTVTTISRGEAPPTAPLDPPVSPLLRLLPVLWLAALLAGLYAMSAVRRVPQLRRYAAIVPLALLLISGAVLAGCAGGKTGTAAGTSQLSITATSGSMSQTTPANSVALTVQ